MNGKFILLFFVFLNLTTILVFSGLGMGTGVYTGMMGSFFEIDAANNITGDLADPLKGALADVRDPERGLFQQLSSVFFDSLKMVLAFIGLITPVPFIALMSSLDIANYVKLIFSIPFVLIWVVSIFEFVRAQRL